MSAKSKKDVLQPFRVAMSGVVYTFKTQRHMRIHLYVVLVVLLVGMLVNFGLRELMVLLFTVSLVVIAEMFNSAIEATVDLIQPNYHPLAKFAKDIAAGAVLITSILAVVIGGLLMLGDKGWERIKINMTSESLGTPYSGRLIIGILIVFVTVLIGKGLGKRGQILRGGLVSGHSAYGVLLAVSVMFITDNALAAGIALLLAAIIAQSRWEAKIHSLFEICMGAAVGVVVGLVLFGLIPK